MSVNEAAVGLSQQRPWAVKDRAASAGMQWRQRCSVSLCWCTNHQQELHLWRRRLLILVIPYVAFIVLGCGAQPAVVRGLVPVKPVSRRALASLACSSIIRLLTAHDWDIDLLKPDSCQCIHPLYDLWGVCGVSCLWRVSGTFGFYSALVLFDFLLLQDASISTVQFKVRAWELVQKELIMDRCKIIHTPSYNQEDVASHCVEAVAAKQQRSNPHFSVFLKTDFPLYSQIDQQYFFVGPNTASYVCGVWEVTPMKPTQRGQV